MNVLIDIMMCVWFFLSVYTINSQNNASLFDFSSFSSWKMNLVDALEKSKFKVPCSFQKCRVKQTKN